MDKHQPEPWYAHNIHLSDFWGVLDANYVRVASDLSEGDARLIAAAPELLEALQELMACAETFDAFDDPSHEFYPVRFQVQDALEKAEGRR